MCHGACNSSLYFRFTAWPQEALKSVACHFLDAVDVREEVKDGVVDVCVDMQQRAREMARRYRSEMGRYYYVTPTSYLELINTFKVTALINMLSLRGYSRW